MPRLPARADEPGPGTARRPPDLRAALLGTAAWAGALGAQLLPLRAWAPAAAVLLCAVVVAHRRGRAVATALSCLVVATAVAGVAGLRAEANRAGPVGRLAEAG